MFNQSVSLVEFPELYNILFELDKILTFRIYNYENPEKFINEIEKNNTECINSTIVLRKKNHSLLNNNKINQNNILVFDVFPLKIEKILDEINVQLIKQKYNFQSKLQIKNYTLNLNSRIFSNKINELRLTEKEIDIILFLKKKDTPQSVNNLQNEVWGYSNTLETHTVETHVYRLRKKIKDKFNDDKFIISHNDGYLI